MPELRILFLADTHLGYDLPFRPRIQRRRRGPEFFANYKQALDDAVALRADCLIHGGDLFYRSKVPPRLVEMVFQHLKNVAAKGIPIFIIPGNHERSTIPHIEIAQHPQIYIFSRPQTFKFSKNGLALGISGFPFVRNNIRAQFNHLIRQTQWQQHGADCRLLCIHQSVVGATVGPGNYMFRWGQDVVRPKEIPAAFAALLAGHIHRFQVIDKDLQGKPLSTPILYPGSTDRVSFAERNESKGYLLIKIKPATKSAPPVLNWTFHPLPTRPMMIVEHRPGTMEKYKFIAQLESKFDQLPKDAIVKLKIFGPVREELMSVLGAKSLRSIVPSTMNVSTTLVDYRRRQSA